ncbi:MAG: hypothetical protein U5N58_06405 [Actinomycetota bacterium]|nr:hypothetical protein [Actinomycetota bacterium]
MGHPSYDGRLKKRGLRYCINTDALDFMALQI